MKESFGHEKRLIKTKEFQRVFCDGKVVTNEWFVGRYVENSKGCARIGIVASKRFGKAHVRNRFKRYVRETFRKMAIEKNIDMLILPRKDLKFEFNHLYFEDFSKSLESLVKEMVIRLKKEKEDVPLEGNVGEN